MPTWRELIDDYGNRVAALEKAVDTGAYDAIPEPFVPGEPPSDPATPAELADFRRLHERAAVLQRRLRAGLDAAWDGFDENRQYVRAARAYGRR